MPLGKKADAGDYVKDFYKSKAPQFKGKSKNKRRQMAIAAYLDARDAGKAKKESTDNLMVVCPKCRDTDEREGCTFCDGKGQVPLQEAMTFRVEVDGLPAMYIDGNSPGQVKNHLRKLIKQPSMIKGVSRMTKHDVKKTYRAKAQGKDVDEMTKQSKIHPNLKIAVGKSAQSAKDTKARSDKRRAQKAGTPLAAGTSCESTVNELSPDTMKRYRKAASNSNFRAAQRYARVAGSSAGRKYKNKEMDKQDDIMRKRKAGISKVDKKVGMGERYDYPHGTAKAYKAATPGQEKGDGYTKEAARIPRKKGQPADSKKHSDLYTDENPKGTIHGLKFATVADAKASVAKIKKSSRKHAHKIQAAIAMEQRARVAGKTAEAAVYRKYINAMKKKTKSMQNENTDRLNRVIDRHATAMKIHKAQFKKTGDAKHMNAFKDAKKRHDHAVQKQSHGKMQNEAIKYTHVAVDKKGKVAGMASKASDAKDMARRHGGTHHQLKKPMHPKVGDMMINRPFNPVLKAAVKVDELKYTTMNKYMSKAQRSKDRATNSAVATILRKGDHSKDLQTMKKRDKGMKLAKSRAVDKIRKGQTEASAMDMVKANNAQSKKGYKTEKISIPKIRNIMYKGAKALGDVQAVRKKKVGKRVARRVAGKFASRALRRLIRNDVQEGKGGKPESFEKQFKRRVVKTTKPEHKEKGYNWRIKGKDRPEISIKLYKSKPGQAEFNKQLRRVAGHEFGG